MKMNYTVFLCVSVFLTIQVTPITANSSEKNRQSDIKDVRERLKGYLQKTNEKFDLSEEEKKLSKMIWDISISDKKVYGKLMSYIRQRYANNLDEHMHGLKSGFYQQHEITSRKGINISTYPLLYLVFRGGVKPLYEYMKLSNSIYSTKDFKQEINVAGKWTDEKWESIWFQDKLLQFHLDRIILQDHMRYIDMRTPHDYRKKESSFDTIDELKRLSEHYGNKEKFKEFVFEHPIHAFSALQWQKERIGVTHTKKQVINQYINYAQTLIEDEDRRMEFLKRVSKRLPNHLSQKLQNRFDD
jgi:hypothetical protein